MLLGLGGALYGVAATTLGGAATTALANPAVPDVTKCHLTDGESIGLQCCPPPFPHPTKIPDFNPKNYPNPVTRMRPPAHKATSDEKYLEKFKEGIRRMKSLPSSDPRSFIQQANVHCTYCDGSYSQVGHPDSNLQIHDSWLFLPFHRCYIYFFERILNKLLDDDQYSFGMPFWNWDHPDGMWIPDVYIDKSSPLYHPLRDSKHQPPTVIDLNYHLVDEKVSNEEQIYWNLYYMYMNVSIPSTAPLFMGRHYVAGDKAAGEPGSLEQCPHNTIHNWTGIQDVHYGRRGMAAFSEAARDPIFYAHHANVDRLWSIWNKLDGGRPNWDHPDFLNAYFVFYDENAQPVRMYVRDCLDTRTLGYDYEKVDLLWEHRPTPPRQAQQQQHDQSIQKLLNRSPREQHCIKGLSPALKMIRSRRLDTVLHIPVKRPERPIRHKEAMKEEPLLVEVLTVQVEVVREDVFAKFDVYINDDIEHDSTERTRATKQYAGSFTTLPHRPKRKDGYDHHMANMVTNLKLPLSKLIEDIGATDNDYLEVVLVPRAGKGAIIIKNVEIEFL